MTTPAPTPSAPLSAAMLAAGAVAFLTAGLLQAMYGPSFALFQARYGVPLAGVGLVASAHFLGSALGPPLSGLLLARYGVRPVVVASVLLLMAGATLIALAPVWPLAVAGALLAGMGLGGVSGALNAAYASLGLQAVNLVNAVFGVGSVLSPLVVTALSSPALASPATGTRWPFMAVVAGGALTLLAARVWGFPAIRATSQDTAPEGNRGATLGLFALLLGVYVGLEVGFGAWAGKHLESLGQSHAALVISGYWGGLTLGRILTGLLGGRLRPDALLTAASAGALACALLDTAGDALRLPLLSVCASVLAGLMLGPIFGTTLAWMTQYLSPRMVPFLLIAGSGGGILMPALLGPLFAHFGGRAVPVALSVAAALLCLVTALTRRHTRRLSGL